MGKPQENHRKMEVYPLVMSKQLWKDPPFLMGKSTISMAIFNSYVKLPEGICLPLFWALHVRIHNFRWSKPSPSPHQSLLVNHQHFTSKTKFRIEISCESPNKIASTTPILSNITKIALPKKPTASDMFKKNIILQKILQKILQNIIYICRCI